VTTVTAAVPARRVAVPWRWVAAAGALGAAGLHVAAAVEHLPAGDLVVGFFLLSAFAQLVLATWLVLSRWLGRVPGTGPVVVALAGTVLLVGLYLVVHTTDLLAGITGHEAGGAAGHATGHEAGHAAGAGGHSAGAATDTAGPVALDARTRAEPDPPDLLGTATVALELLSVLGLTALLPLSWRGRTVNTLLALGGLAWVAWLTGLLG
jgi:hypothetical protein